MILCPPISVSRVLTTCSFVCLEVLPSQPSATIPMQAATRRRPQTSAPGDGSRTITIHDNGVGEQDDEGSNPDAAGPSGGSTGVLRLRGGPRSRPQVAWQDDVVDNEGFGRKKSKSMSCTIIANTPNKPLFIILVCCIYHKPKKFDESSDESDSDSSDCEGHNHDHPAPRSDTRSQVPGPGQGPSQVPRNNGGSEVLLQSDPGPNAYEKSFPKSKSDKGKSK